MLQSKCPPNAQKGVVPSNIRIPGINSKAESAFLAEAAENLGNWVNIARGETVPLSGGYDIIILTLSGATKLIAKASDEREQIVAFYFANDLVPISAPEMHAYSLQALDDSQIVVFNTRDLLEAAEANHTFLTSLLQRSFISLYRCRDKALGLGRKTAQERLASFFVAMAERIGSNQHGTCQLNLPMSRGDIADSLGLTIETVSRQFTELRQAGLIETDGRSHVTLLHMPALIERTGQFRP